MSFTLSTEEPNPSSQTTDAMDQVMRDLLRAGQEVDRCLVERATALGDRAVRPLLEMAVDERLHTAASDSPEVWAPLHAIRILGEMGAAEAVDPLLTLLDQDSDECLNQALCEAFGGIGAPAVAPLRSRLFDRSRPEWFCGLTARCLAGIGRSHPALRSEVIAALVERLDPAESQVPEDETVNAFVVAVLGEMRAVEAEAAIRSAFAEDRVDREVVELDDVLDDLGIQSRPPSSGPAEDLRLSLRCTACGYSRPHVVRRVYCDYNTLQKRDRGETTKYSPYVIPQRISCPRCGAVDQYEFDGMAYLALTAELLKLMAHKKGAALPGRGDGEPESRIVLRNFVMADGRALHPLEGRDFYRTQVAEAPDRADLRVRYGNVLMTLGYHEEARAEYQTAVELDPACTEACLNLGSLCLQAGEEAQARRLFDQVVEVAPRDNLPSEKRAAFVRAAREALDGDPAAVRDMHSIGEYPVDRAEPARPFRNPGPKIGRNEPCPCGSGKKYKKCHLG